MPAPLSGPTDRSDEGVRNAVFVIRTTRASGTAFVVGDGLHLLTASHVVKGAAPGAEVLIYNARYREPRTAFVERLLDPWDLALLQLDEPLGDSAVQPFLISQQPPVAGTNFSTYGYPVEYESGWFYGIVGNEESDRQYTVNFSVTFDPAVYGGTLEGLSGGPVFDMRDRSTVIAIMTEHGPVNYQRGKVTPLFHLSELLEPAWLSGQRTSPDQGHKDWGDAPDIETFFGRTRELASLRQWILKDNVRLVGIVGMAGVGKTRLSLRLAKGGIGKTGLALELAQGIQDEFDFIIWRRLLNSPKATELVPNLINSLSAHTEPDVPGPITHQVPRLLYYLRNYRCLVILDNLETVLESPASYRQGYDDYGYLLRNVAETQHQSCLILTSREKPSEIASMESKRGFVRCLELGGLGQRDAKRVFDAIGSFRGSRDNWQAINALYNGNPLALELAAHHIKDVFEGNVAEFLDQGAPVFSDLRELLDWHFDRLPDDQREVMYWLAICRDPISISELQYNIYSSSLKRAVPSLLQQVQRSIPVQKSVGGFSLQPVLNEYITERFVASVSGEIVRNKPLLLRSHCLMQATTSEHVKESQIRMIVLPVIDQLSIMPRSDLEDLLHRALDQALGALRRVGSYTAGNLLNLILQIGLEPANYDFSNTSIRQADFQGKIVRYLNLRDADFVDCVFTETFSNVLSVAFNPNGALLAGSTDGGEVWIWQTSSATAESVFRGHTDWVWAVTFSTDNRFVISGGSDRTIRLWDVQNGSCVAVMEGHSSEVRCLALSSDGGTLVSGSQDRSVRLWDLRDRRCIRVLEGHQKQVRTVAVSPDGRLIVSGSEDRDLRLWDAHTGECIWIMTGHTGMVRSVSFSLNGITLVSGSDDQTIRMWDVRTGQCTATLERDAGIVYRTIFSPDGKLIASINEDQTIRLWDTTSGQDLKAFQGRAGLIGPVRFNTEAALAFSPDGRLLASGNQDQTVRLWDVASGQCLRTMQGYANPVYAAVFSPDSEFLVTGSEDHSVTLWRTGTPARSLRGHAGAVWAVAVSRSGRMIASGSNDRSVRLWDVQSVGATRVFDGHSDRINAVAFSPDDRYLATASADLTVRLWELRTGKQMMALEGHSDSVWAVVFNPRQPIIASGSEDGTIRVWDLHTGASIKTLTGHQGRVYGLAYSSSGSLLASGSSDNTIGIWYLNEDQPRKRLSGHSNRVRSVSFSPDESLLASASVDGTVRIWDVESTRCLQIYEGHEGIVWSVNFDPAGNVVVSTGNDGTIRLWNIQTNLPPTILIAPRPYEGINIARTSGLTSSQVAAMVTLGALTS